MWFILLWSCGAAPPEPAPPDPAACFSRVAAVFAADPDPARLPPGVLDDLACACDGASPGTLPIQACATLGTFRRDGIDGPPDPVAAVARFSRGCDLGDGWACNDLGVAHGKGQGTERSASLALAAYRRGCAAQMPSVKACSNAGLDLFQGRGGVQDLPAALVLFERGCALGDAISCNQAMVTRNVEAYRSSNRARCALTGDPEGCANYAVSLPPGHPERRSGLERACAGGASVACELAAEAP